MFLLNMIQVNVSTGGISEKMQTRVDSLGVWGAGLLGTVFALSFCPVSAALFFGSLIPLSIKYDSRVTLPAIYGIGTALPVLVFAVIIALSPVGRQSVQPLDRDRTVGAADHGGAVPGGRRLLRLRFIFEVL